MTNTSELDERDREILAIRQAIWDRVEGARVGDWCRMPDTSMRRFTHNWGDDLQTNSPNYGFGSFYFGKGYMDYSGGLDPAIPRARLHDTGETLPGSAWFFHHNEHRANNGVYFDIPCRVFEFR